MVTEAELDAVLRRMARVRSAVVDSSSLIHLEACGLFGLLAGAVELVTVPGVLRETGFDGAGLTLHAEPGGEALPVDNALLSAARTLGLPLISEDRKLLLACRDEEIDFYNSLTALGLLLLRGKVLPNQVPEVLRALDARAHYSRRVFRYGEILLQHLVKSL